MIRQMVVVLALATCCSLGAQAQMGGVKAPSIAPGTIVSPAKSFDALLKIYEDEMMGAGECDASGQVRLCAERSDIQGGPEGRLSIAG